MTRVVGRVPDLVGEGDPAFLLALLATAATYTQRSPASYRPGFVLGAAAWHGSTSSSAALLPGPPTPVQDSPPASTGWTGEALAPLLHLVNCHGADTTPDWFGQRPGGPIDTVALRPEDVTGQLGAGTVVAAECCFGAMHQAPGLQGGRPSLLAAYLHSGAYAALGSSTTSYGPAEGNGQADLVCRFFLENVVAGSSSGRALLEARQRFARESGALAPEDLKTLAQFDLLGDPSLHPVSLAAPHGAPVGPVGPVGLVEPTTSATDPGTTTTRGARRSRRAALAAEGRALDRTLSRAERRSADAGPDPVTTAEELAAGAGVRARDVGRVRSVGEHRRGRRRGRRFLLAPLVAGSDAGRSGFVVGSELDGVLRARVVLRR